MHNQTATPLTVMQQAFTVFLGAPLVAKPHPTQQWNASLSFNTFNTLKNQGVMK